MATPRAEVGKKNEQILLTGADGKRRPCRKNGCSPQPLLEAKGRKTNPCQPYFPYADATYGWGGVIPASVQGHSAGLSFSFLISRTWVHGNDEHGHHVPILPCRHVRPKGCAQKIQKSTLCHSLRSNLLGNILANLVSGLKTTVFFLIKNLGSL